MYLLDTDHMSLLERDGKETDAILRRLRTLAPDDLATTVISYEEQMRGWLARIAQADNSVEQIWAYARLKRQLQNYCRMAVVDYTEAAAARFDLLQKARMRIGTMDLKIAAIALANNATVLTRNRRDFEKVPGLRFEDWTV